MGHARIEMGLHVLGKEATNSRNERAGGKAERQEEGR